MRDDSLHEDNNKPKNKKRKDGTREKSVSYPLPDSRYLPPRYLQKTCQSTLTAAAGWLMLGLSQQASLFSSYSSSTVFLSHSLFHCCIRIFLQRYPVGRGWNSKIVSQTLDRG